MRERAVSSVGVVTVGLVPAIAGGPVFMAVFVAIAVLSCNELLSMMRIEPSPVIWAGYTLIAGCGVVPLLWPEGQGLPLIVVAIAIVPLVTAILVGKERAVSEWTWTVASLMYLGVPTFAAVDMRELTGESADWVRTLASWLPYSRDDTGRGLGWLLLAILTTWMADSGAYLVGRSIGRRKLIPRLSPNKTVEGAAGGLAAAVLTSILCVWAFGLDISPALGGLLGLGLGTIGILGDLAESMLKRHAGVKDSGSLIPGHGGMLDRIDAMLFVILGTWLVAPVFA